ncbi:MAG: DUF2231 domain-containing protein [Bacteroidota bacterium]|nr:DUF2231 domain-containing protein [Bacteroidota bacterium]MDP4233202.1 DUF2231 domain-containing protein [Bacteroidota bacterium]MDP4242179.1 DUF2231 domain-containing protein [Bacteroidota bacterium]MDP4287829.1 DUF2231 domain-containing protein [Bacteroidota bacterium]
MLRDLLRGKLFGHPIHVMLVHFPAALLPTAAAFDALGIFGHLSFMLDITLLLWPGVTMGWLAVGFGLWDLIRLPQASPELSMGLVHGGINASALSGFTWALFLASHPGDQVIRLAVELLCTVLMLVGNKFGGDLIFRYGVGRTKPGAINQ